MPLVNQYHPIFWVLRPNLWEGQNMQWLQTTSCSNESFSHSRLLVSLWLTNLLSSCLIAYHGPAHHHPQAINYLPYSIQSGFFHYFNKTILGKGSQKKTGKVWSFGKKMRANHRPPSVPIGFVPQKSHSQAGLASKSETVRMPHWLGVRSNSQRVRCDLLCAPLKNPQPQLKLTRDVFLDKKTFWRSNCFINWKPKKW